MKQIYIPAGCNDNIIELNAVCRSLNLLLYLPYCFDVSPTSDK